MSQEPTVEPRIHWQCTICDHPKMPEHGCTEMKWGVHQSCLDDKRREQKALAVFQAAKLRGAAAMLEAREVPMRDEDVDRVVGGAYPVRSSMPYGFSDPNELPRIPENVR